jgi:hypothetical protein
MRSFSRRQQASSAAAIEVRGEAELATLEQLLLTCTACKHMTRNARLMLAKVAKLTSADAGEDLVYSGMPMSTVYFVMGGQVGCHTVSCITWKLL